MARVFTTEFNYQKSTYTAVISQVDGHITIYVPDESLHGILPNGKLSFNPQQGIKIDAPRLTPVQNLLLSIMSTVDLKAESELNQDKHAF